MRISGLRASDQSGLLMVLLSSRRLFGHVSSRGISCLVWSASFLRSFGIGMCIGVDSDGRVSIDLGFPRLA